MHGEITHADHTHVMGTLIEPTSPYFPYEPGMYVYMHPSAFETGDLRAVECLVVNVDLAPLEIVVHPCNHPEQAVTVAQDKLSAPIWV